MENKTFNVAVMGAGNIGSAVISRLLNLDKGIVGLNVKTVSYTHLTLPTILLV